MENQVEEIQKHSKLYVTYGTEDCYSHSAANLGKKLLSEQVDILNRSLGWNEWYNILQKRIQTKIKKTTPIAFMGSF